MAHQSWYRTYRPQSFDAVVGQTHIERTLKNAVTEDSVAHAYLFTGPRGTGKTTTARILAKALNCENGPTATPDETCEDCLAIAAGTHPDVYELDAASRTGVNDVREEIIGRVNYAPTRGHWKVYIIDEVHMLSTAAFNALLKTLEEPPSHTVFILCTTHPHKVPETIHSRCQRFDFHRLSVEEIVSRLRFIADAEHVEVSDSALALIGKHALGGMRDAISTLEQMSSFSGGSITLEDVEGLLGEVDVEVLFEAAELVCDRDVAGAFHFVADLAERGVDMAEFVKGFVRHCRDLYVVAAVPDAGETVDVTANDRTRLERQARGFGVERLVRLLDILDKLSGELRWAADQRLALEVALTRMARPETDLTLESLAERIAALESGLAVPPPSRASAAPTAPAAPRKPLPGASPEPAPHSAAPASAPAEQTAPAVPAVVQPSGDPLDAVTAKRSWPAVQAEIRRLRPSRAQLFNMSEVEVEGELLVIEFPKDQRLALDLASDPETMQLLRKGIAAVLGVTPPMEFRLGREGSSSAGTKPTSRPAPVAQPEVAPTSATMVEDVGAPAAEPADATHADMERMVIDELGAEIVAEHENDAV